MTAHRQTIFSIKENLAQHVACAETLLKLLADEKSALLGNDIDTLSRLCESKASAAATLQILSQRLNKACGSGDPLRIEAHISAGGDADLLQRWRELLKLAARLQKLNLENGALLQERQTRVRSILQTLQRGSDKPLYGRDGASPLAAARRALALA